MDNGYQMLFRERQQILICVAAAGLLGGFVFVRYLPLRKKTRDIGQAKAAQAAAVARTVRQSSQLPDLKNQLAELEAVVGDYGQRVPGHEGLGMFLQQLTNLMNKYELREQQINPGTQVEAEGLSCKPVSIECKGRLDQIFEFFSSLQALDRLVRIEEIKLLNASDFGGDVSMQTRVAIFNKPPTEQG